MKMLHLLTHASFNRSVPYLWLALVAGLAAGDLQASVVAEHIGSADPVNDEGWSTVGSGLSVTVGAINDGGTPSWFVDDTSSTNGAALFYKKDVTAMEVTDAAANGWILSTTIRVPSSSRSEESYSPFVAYIDGLIQWTMGFDVIAGNTVVQLVTGFNNLGTGSDSTTGPTFTLSGTSTYNTFELRFDPVSSTADLLVNDVEQLSDYAGLSGFSATPAVEWGAGASLDIGRGNFNEVTFEINSGVVPEAGSLAMWSVLTALGLIVRRR